jgi:hypothetical protein
MSNKLIPLTPSDLYCIETLKTSAKPFIDKEYMVNHLAFYNKEGKMELIDLKEDNWQILGVMSSSTEISFDPAPYLQSVLGFYKIHGSKERLNGTSSALKSITSLLEINGLYWENPMGEKPIFSYSDYETGHGGLSEKRNDEHRA